MGKTLLIRYWHPVVTISPFQVKVEGYLVDMKTFRSDRSRPYRSSQIVESIKPRVLLSKSGTIYNLDGPVDLRQCRASGMSQDLIDQFETGFPINYASVLNPRAREAHLETHPLLDNSHCKPVVKLKKWFLRMMLDGSYNPEKSPFDGFAISLEGIKTDTGEVWRTCEIQDVLKPQIIQSQHCNYQLVGLIDGETCQQHGFSQDFVRKFEKGFPQDWRQCLTACYQDLSSSRTKKPSAKDPPRKSLQTKALREINLAQYLDTPYRLEEQALRESRSARGSKADARTTERVPTFIDDFEDDELDKSFDPMRERRKIEKMRAERNADSDDWSDDEEENNLPGSSKKKKPKPEKKPKKWTKAELEKLRIALLAVAPRDPDQWQNIAKSLHGTRTAEECKVAATEQLKWRRKEEGDDEDGEEDNEDAPCGHITAKKGTAKFKIQTDQFTRNFLLGGSEDDRFDDILPPSRQPLIDLDMSIAAGDNSYMEAVRTPGPGSVKRPNKRKLNQQAMFTLDESSDASKEEEDGSEQPFSQEDPERSENVQRYVHQIIKKGKFAKTYRPKKQKKLNSAVLARINEMAMGDALRSAEVKKGRHDSDEEEDEEAREEEDDWSNDE
uniref:Myb-like domain-containing protein n=1 Tax=Steinernema glaseri TaxID=37863 RepID=A0A1I7Z708_9BILA